MVEGLLLFNLTKKTIGTVYYLVFQHFIELEYEQLFTSKAL
jgi:hypothetical protein